jgi:hypothetical protein
VFCAPNNSSVRAVADCYRSVGKKLDLRERVANALVNKGVTLGALDRSEDEIAVYDDVLARVGTATELPLRERVANALVNKGVTRLIVYRITRARPLFE